MFFCVVQLCVGGGCCGTQGDCFQESFEDDDEAGEADGDDDDETPDGNVAYACCDLIGAFAKVTSFGALTCLT